MDVDTNYIHILCRAKFWHLADQLFQRFCEENVDKFTIAIISYFSDSEIWLGKILTLYRLILYDIL